MEESQIISKKQFSLLLGIYLFCSSVFWFPTLFALLGNKMEFLTLLGGVFLAFFYIFLLLFWVKQQELVPNLLKKCIWILYFIKHIILTIASFWLISNILKSTLLQDHSFDFILITLLFVCVIIASIQIEALGRLAQIVVALSIIPLLIFFVLGLKEINVNLLLQNKSIPISDYLQNCYIVLFFYSIFDSILFFYPFIKKEQNSNTCFYKQLIKIMLFQGIMILLSVGTLGRTLLAKQPWANIGFLQSINIFGSYVNRQDALLLFLLLLSCFVGLTFQLCTLCQGISLLTECKKKPAYYFFLLLICLFIYIIVIALQKKGIPLKPFFIYSQWIGTPQIILVFLSVLLGKRRKRRTLISIFLFSSILFCSCGINKEIEDRDFVMAIGISSEQESTLKITYAFPDLSEQTNQSVGEGKQYILTYSGKNLLEAEEQYKTTSDKKLDYSHVKVMILQSELLKQNHLESILHDLENQYSISRNTLIFTTDDNVEKLLQFDKNVNGSIGIYIENLYLNQLQKREKAYNTLGNLLVCYYEGKAIELPVLLFDKILKIQIK